jgi:glutamate 5-kinase
MYSKLKAAREAASHGIETWLVRADEPNVLLQVAGNESVGTLIEAQKKGRRS